MTLYIVWLIKAWSFPMDLLPTCTNPAVQSGAKLFHWLFLRAPKVSNIWSHISTLQRNHSSRNYYYCCRQVLFLHVGARGWLQGESTLCLPQLQALLLHLLPSKAKLRTSEPLFWVGNALPHSRFTLASRNPRDLKEAMLLVQLKWIRPEHRTGFPEFGFTSQYRNHLEPSGDTRSTQALSYQYRSAVWSVPEATGVQKILPHLACSVICSLNFIKIKTQRSLRHSCVPTDVNSFRSLSGG